MLAIGRVTHTAYYEFNKNPDARGKSGPYSNHLNVQWEPLAKSFKDLVFPRNAIYEISGDLFRELTSGFKLSKFRNGHQDTTQDIVDALEAAKEQASGQGFCTPQVRKALEEHAVNRAKDYFGRQGFNIREAGRPYDLCCTRNRTVLFVEVKGTQGSWEKVILTRNEVNFARRKRKQMVLFVLHDIRITGNPNKPLAIGGTLHILHPWDVDAGRLDPPAYEYHLPH